jgi:sulfur carrier protein ThiS
MKLIIEKENKTRNIKIAKISVKDLLKKLKLSQNTVLVIKNNELVSEEEIIFDKDTIKIMSVVSGG